jgi:hypothetical protein
MRAKASQSALHEAAHAFAAYAERIAIKEVRLDPKPECIAAVPDLAAVAYDPVQRAMVAPSIRVALAALAADAFMGRDLSRGLSKSKDLLFATEQVEALGLHRDEFIDSAWLFMERQAGRARDLIARFWPTIQLLASELERKRKLKGAEVAWIIRHGRALEEPDWPAILAEIARPYVQGS